MRRLFLLVALFALVLTACGGDDEESGDQSAFDIWDVSADDVPDYEIADTLTDEAGALFSVQVEIDGWDETETKQVFADIIESNRTEYPVVVIRGFGDGQRIGIFAESEDGLSEIAQGYNVDMEQANEAGYPALIYFD